MSSRGPAEMARAVSAVTRDLLGRIRRMAITRTNSAIWQIAGHVLLDGTKETRNAEVFSGHGFYARPPSSGTPEAIVVFPGGAGNPIIVATRDETTRKAVFQAAGELAAGETAIFNGTTIVVLKVNGTVEIRSVGGVAQALVTKADHDALVSWIKNQMVIITPSGNSTPGTAPLPAVQAPSATGTTVLKAQ